MAESITFKDPKDGRDYTLEYDRDSVRFAEELGVNVVDMVQGKVRIATLWTGLFYSALHKHHPTMSQQQADDIWSRVPNKADVAAALQEMISVPFLALLGDGEDEGSDPKNAVVIKLPKRAASAKPKAE